MPEGLDLYGYQQAITSRVKALYPDYEVIEDTLDDDKALTRDLNGKMTVLSDADRRGRDTCPGPARGRCSTRPQGSPAFSGPGRLTERAQADERQEQAHPGTHRLRPAGAAVWSASVRPSASLRRRRTAERDPHVRDE